MRGPRPIPPGSPLIRQGQEITMVCELTSEVIESLPWQGSVTGLEIVSIEAEPMDGPRH